MSCSHHNPGNEAMDRFLDQMNNKARREYPAGRMGADDDGALSYAIANDDKHKTIIIRFGKPVEWFAMGLEEALQLSEQLDDRIRALRGLNDMNRLADKIDKMTAQ